MNCPICNFVIADFVANSGSDIRECMNCNLSIISRFRIDIDNEKIIRIYFVFEINNRYYQFCKSNSMEMINKIIQSNNNYFIGDDIFYNTTKEEFYISFNEFDLKSIFLSAKKLTERIVKLQLLK